MKLLFLPPLRAWGLGLLLVATAAQAQDSDRSDWLRNPAMGNYKAYAEFKMAHYAAAREVWETLATVGNGDALFNLAILAEDGLGEPRDMARAEQLYLSAAQGGNFKAQYRLGMLYSAGTLLPQNLSQARVFLSLAAQAGDADAAARLAALNRAQANSGHAPVPPSAMEQAELFNASGRYAEAVALYTPLADAGNATAQTRLAWMYEAGRGVPRDLDEAARRFQMAAEAGAAEAQYALAVMLRTGQGRPKNLPLSLTWLQRAADQHHPAATAALAASHPH
ncbi:MAG: sel1 repeat family protein [Polaromonas sp.]|nr:sel1 repeat family protein [Polaromonas sp.]